MPVHDKDVPAEKVLFDAADALRGSVESAVYKHLVLGLVFLKYVSDAFATQRARLDARTREPDSDWFTDDEDEREAILEDRDEYAADNVFWIPREARWDAILALGSQPDLGVQIDRALDVIEQENPALKGILPKIYAGAPMSPETLGRARVDPRARRLRRRPRARPRRPRPRLRVLHQGVRALRGPPRRRVLHARERRPGARRDARSPTRAESSTRRADPAACSSSRRSSSPRTPAGPRSSRSTARR